MDELQTILDQALQQFAAIGDEAELERVKARFLGKEGSLTVLLKCQSSGSSDSSLVTFSLLMVVLPSIISLYLSKGEE